MAAILNISLTTLLIVFTAIMPQTRESGERPLRMSVQEFREKSRAEKIDGLAVELEGVITYCGYDFRYICFLEDDSGGIFLDGIEQNYIPGTVVRATGRATWGRHNHFVRLTEPLTEIKHGAVPPPSSHHLLDFLSGHKDACLVQYEAVVSRAAMSTYPGHQPGKVVRLDLYIGREKIIAHVNAPHIPAGLTGARVRIKGVAGGFYNEAAQLVGLRWYVNEWADVEIVEAGYSQIDEVPHVEIGYIGHRESSLIGGDFVRVKGVVTGRLNNGDLVVQEGEAGLRIEISDELTVDAGEHVWAVGRIERGPIAPYLVDATIEKESEHRSLLLPKTIGPETQPVPAMEATLVRLEGVLETTSVLHGRVYYFVRIGERLIEVQVPQQIVSEKLEHIELGSLVGVTGLASIRFSLAEERSSGPYALVISVRSEEDVELLRAPPWWTGRRLLYLTIFIFSLLGLMFLWTFTLRKRVRSQTKLIRTQLSDMTQLKIAAEAADRSKSAFLATISHELRTPMNGVLGLAQLMRETSLDEEQKEYLSMMVNCSHSLQEVISDIVDYSQLDHAEMVLNVTRFDLIEMVESAYDVFGDKAANKGIEFAICISPDVPRWILGDKQRIGQVVFNVLANAVKFTGKGTIVLEVLRAKRDQDVLNTIVFRVSDTGIGIKQDKMKELFQPFRQADSSATRIYGGTGLGLAITQRLLDLMGGKIEAESIYGSGSTFTCFIPVRVLTPPPEPASFSPDILIDMQLGIMDLIPARAGCIEQWLGKAGARVIQYNNGHEISGAIASRVIEGVILDDAHPDYHNVMASLVTHKIPCIRMTRVHQDAANPHIILPKPVKLASLFEAFRKLPYSLPEASL